MVGYDFDMSGNRVVGVEFDGRWDTSDEIGGLFTLRAKYRAPFSSGNWIFDGGVESTYASAEYMNEFFGVSTAGAARSGLQQFDAESGIKDVGVNAGLTYKINPKWSATGLASFKRLLGDAEDSPVTDDEGDASQFFIGVLINISF